MLATLFNLNKEQDRDIARDFRNEALVLVGMGYSDELVRQTVCSILRDIPEKHLGLKNEIKAELIKNMPYMEWCFMPLVRR